VIVNPGGRFGVYMALSTAVKEGRRDRHRAQLAGVQEGLQYIGARAISVHTTLEEGWQAVADAIHDAIRPNTKGDHPELPREPDGAIISPSKFMEIVGVANDHKLTVISDEIYTDYA